MSRYFRTVLLLLSLAPAAAQAYQNSNEVGRHFSAGANRIGQGASQIGEGFKQGAILTWHAMQHGAHAVSDSFTK